MWKGRMSKKGKLTAVLLTAMFLWALPPGLFLEGDNGIQKARGVPASPDPGHISDRLFIKYRDPAPFMTLSLVRAAVEEIYGLESIRHFDFIDTYLYKARWDPRETMRILHRDPHIEYVETDRKVHRDALYPNDPRFSSLWALHNTGQNGGQPDADIDAPEAWSKTTGRRGVVVAILDSGIDYNHEDLRANMWVNPGETAGNGLDDDGNGYVDDVYGINAITGGGDPMDDDGHGTHVAGIVGAVGNNGIGLAGVCWNCSLMALKFLDAEGDGFLSNELEGIEYAINHGADILNGSFGTYDPSRVEENAIRAAQGAGLLFVFSSGNDGINDDQSPHYPSAYEQDNIIAVAATDRWDELAPWSNYGHNSVDVAAPGASILSTIPGNGYSTQNGTSMASPHVAGTAALIKAYDSSLTWQQVKSRLLSSCDALSALSGKVLSGGRINVNNALVGQGRVTLILRSGSGGTTDPPEGEYTYSSSRTLTIRALPDQYFRFTGWSGDVEAWEASLNPLTIFLQQNRILTANFIRIIYPPAQAAGTKILNRSLSQAEYLVQLTWQAHPDNIDITKYKIYLWKNEAWDFLMQLNNSTFSYQHRRVKKEGAYTYKLVAINSDEREGDPAIISVQ
jgi:subtilisin family serine protease